MPAVTTHRVALSLENCYQILREEQINRTGNLDFDLISGSAGETWCSATWDQFLCWPATQANHSAVQQCPPHRLFDGGKYVSKLCHESGYWLGRDDTPSNVTGDAGYTNYMMCLAEQSQGIASLIESGGKEHLENVSRIAKTIELVGLSFSLLFTMFVLLFSIKRGERKKFTTLMKNSLLSIATPFFGRLPQQRIYRVAHYRIFRQLLISVILAVIVRMVLNLDQAITLNSERLELEGNISRSEFSIHTTPYLCVTFYALVEYAKLANVAWFMMQSLHLHNVLVWPRKTNPPQFWHWATLGWVSPAVIIIVWMWLAFDRYNAKGITLAALCADIYFLQPEYWLIRIVHLLELSLSVILITSISSVLFIKGRRAQTVADALNYRNSAIAGFILTLVLAVPHIFDSFYVPPTPTNMEVFELYTYASAFFTTFQGAMVAMLYCMTDKKTSRIFCRIRRNGGEESTRNRAENTLSIVEEKETAILLEMSKSGTVQKPLPD